MAARRGQSPGATGLIALFEDFNDAVGAGIHEDRPAIDHGIAIIANAVFLRHVVVRDPVAGQVGTHPHIALVGVRRVMPLDDVAVKAGTLIDAEHTIDTADHATDDATDNSADRPGCAFAFAGAAFNASGYALGGSDGGQKK
jgi:hypothetical protein